MVTNVLELLANVVMKRYLLGNMILTIVVSPRMNPVMKIKALATVKVDKKSYLKIFVKTKANALYHGMDMYQLKATVLLIMIVL